MRIPAFLDRTVPLVATLALSLAACTSAPPPTTAAARAVAPATEPRTATLPTPYTAAEIREANPPGTWRLMRIEQSGQPVVIQEVVFVGGDETTAVMEVRTVDEQGRPLEQTQRSEASWRELRDHAAFPAALATRESARCTVPAGQFDGWRYTVRDPVSPSKTNRLTFAQDRPGPPVLFETEVDGRVEFRMSLVDSGRRVSSFGRYEGYSWPRYDEWVVTSQYVTMRDGVDLAVDIVRPAVDGVATEERVPVVWTHSRYHRSPAAIVRHFGGDADRVRTMVDNQPDLQLLVRHGYAVAAVAVRGSGASFGTYQGLFSPAETRDAYEICQWLASRPWCTGDVGMFGGSYLGMTQYLAASQNPPSLKAIFPFVAGFDMYDTIYPGGIYRDDMIEHWDGITRQLDAEWTPMPVDDDPEGRRLSEALAAHADNWDVAEGYGARFRDTTSDSHSYATHNPSPFLDAINRAAVPAYHWNGWYDIFVLDATLWFANYRGPQKLCIGPWSHTGTADPAGRAELMRLQSIEQLRWFDRWLKGIDNGIDREPPVNYATMDEPDAWSWHVASQWPPAGIERMTLHFADGPSGSVDSVNDGRLVTEVVATSPAFDEYQVDLTTTTGPASRWDNAVGAAPVMQYGDLTANDRKSLTYTTTALDSDLVVTGHPVVTLHVTCTDREADFYVLLEEVDEAGVAHYVTEGVLRGSHRALAEPPWNNMGLPYQRSHAADRADLPRDEPAPLVLDLHPTSTVFNAGHRVRVTIMGADADNTEPVPLSSPPTIRIHRDPEHPSGIALPIR